jgi:internalin A
VLVRFRTYHLNTHLAFSLSEEKLDNNDFIANLRTFLYALRHGQTEKVLATLVLGLFGLATYLRQEWNKELPQAAYLAFALCACSALLLIWRIWKRAMPQQPQLPAGPVPSAIKGLLAFTVADGKLFAQLGRHMELQRLLGLAQNDGIAISVVRGESGAGKTSLLLAGLVYTLGESQCIYWEAVREKASDALLHAICTKVPEIESLESLPEACPKRYVLILDQFEQLHMEDPAHTPIFALIDRITKSPSPHKLSVIVGFRREYTADWLDLEKEHNFHAEQVPINLLAPRTASDALVLLTSEAGFTLDQALVDNFVTSVAGPRGVSPVDIAVGVLTLANFVQQRGTTQVEIKEYSLAGGAEGLLLSFVQQKLEEIPEAMRSPLLKGIVLALINFSDNQRVAGGEAVPVIASKSGVSQSSLLPLLERLAHPRARILEKLGADRYRLPHERLVPVLRRLAGETLASLDRLRLLFDAEYVRWLETHDRRHLLVGKDLRDVLRYSAQFVKGESAAGKADYLAACLKRRVIVRVAAGVGVAAMVITGYGAYRFWDSALQRQKLASWRKPPEIFQLQDSVDEIDFRGINDIGWLRSHHLKKLNLEFLGSRLVGLDKLKGLSSLSLGLTYSNVTSLSGLENLKSLKVMSLDLRASKVTSLAPLEELKGLASLQLKLGNSKVKSLAPLAQLEGLTSLSLDLASSEVTSLAGLEHLKGLTSLSLNLTFSRIIDLRELEQLKGLSSLSLDLGPSEVTSLAGLEHLRGLTSLSLGLSSSEVRSLAGLEHLKGLTSLSLDLSNSGVASLAELEQMTGLASLSLRLWASQVTTLAPLEQLKRLATLSLQLGQSNLTTLGELERLKALTSLSLDLGYSKIKSLAEIRLTKGLTSLSLDLAKSEVTSLAGLDNFKALRSLSLVLNNSDVPSLAGLEQLKGLTSLSLYLPASLVQSLAELGQLKGLTSLSLSLNSSPVTTLAGLEQLKQLTSLSLDLSSSRVTNLSGLEQLKGLTSLSLNLYNSNVTSVAQLEYLKELTSLSLDLGLSSVGSLAEVGRLTGLTSIELKLPASLVSSFSGSTFRHDITTLQIEIDENTVGLDVPVRCKFVSLIDH